MTGLLAAAGSGSSNYSGGGGGGGFSSGSGGGSSFGSGFDSGGSGGSGTAAPLPGWMWLAFVAVLLVWFLAPKVGIWWKLRARAAKRRKRVARVELASHEAAADDPLFAADAVKAAAARLFVDIQAAWDARDRGRLATLVQPSMFAEWARRLDDFDRKGWHNRVQVLEAPQVDYVGIENRAGEAEDRVVVHLTANTRDYVEVRGGSRLRKNAGESEYVTLNEYWRLGKRPDGQGWWLLSIEQDEEGSYQLSQPLITAPWGDERLRDDAIAERATAEAAPAGYRPAELADLDFEGTARAAALDLALADGRFDPDLIEASVRRAVAAWAEAVDGEDAALEAAARPEAVRALLYPGAPNTRLVVRGPEIRAIRIAALDAAAETFAVEVAVRGRRYLENRDTQAVVLGSRDAAVDFTERWTLALDGDGQWPWRIAATGAAVAS